MKSFLHPLRYWGAPGWIGLACLLLSVLVWQLEDHWNAQSARVSQDTAAMRQGLLATAARAASQATARQPSWPDLRGQLPAAVARDQRLSALLLLAERKGLASQRLDMETTRNAPLGSESLRVTQPLKGPYLRLRQFVEEALAADPAMSLDRVQLRRATPEAVEVDAEFTWSLHQRSAEVAQ